MDANKVWVGAGIKVGGTAIVAGFENIQGGIVQMSNPRSVWGYQTNSSLRLGLGIGGGVQVVGLFYLNVNNPQDISLDDWGVDLSLGERWSSIVSTIRHSPTAARFWSIAFQLSRRNINADILQKTRDMAHVVSNSYSAGGGSVNNQPMALVVDVPMLGAGWGVGVTYTFAGRANIYGPPVIA